MEIRATTDDPPDTGADTIVVGVFDGKGVPHDVEDGALGALVESGEARSAFRKLAHTHAAGRRWILIGLGARDDFDAERAGSRPPPRSAARASSAPARSAGSCRTRSATPSPARSSRARCWPPTATCEFKSEPGADRAPDALVVSAHHDVAAAVEAGRVGAEAANRARDLGNAPANTLTPEALAARARELDGVQVEVMGRAEIEAAGMGAFAAIAQGSDHEPQLITIRHEPPGAAGPLLGLVGKAVTFDTGGYSIKPAARMHEMKFDMCGGAAVLEATGAIAQLGLPVRIVSVIGATENMVSARAARPGDIVRSRSGVTIELNNTDAEGRLVLADCLTHARDQGAERLLDLATLTGGIVSTFGSVHAGLMGTDDALVRRRRGGRRGDRRARLAAAAGPALRRADQGPLRGHLQRRRSAARRSRSRPRAFLQRFAGDVPWAHLDIAGVADDLGRPYARKGASGWGVRLLVELARAPRCFDGRMDFDLSPDHELIRRTVRDFAEGEVAPVAEELDRTKAFPYEIVAQLGELGLMGIPFPEEVGGAGGDSLAYAIAVEELARVDSSVAITMCAHTSLGTQPIYLFGSAEQQAEWLPELTRGAQARRVRADRAGGRLGRRQRAHAGAAGRRRVGDRRRQAVHHQRRHRHLGRRQHHRAHRRATRSPT